MQENFAEILHTELFQILHRTTKETKVEAYVIGGFVRDYFLGLSNVRDIDIVVVGSGIELAKAVQKRLPNAKPVQIFKNYGTAMIQWDGIQIEFVGARKESYRAESRNPEVQPGTLEDDQNRRDFTVNALAIGLSPDNFGQVIDPFGGMNDLAAKILRTPLDPEATFSDDPLRMLRAIRFACQLDFTIVSEALKAIQQNAARIEIISKERIVEELHKILLTQKPSKGFVLLEQTGLLPHILPELTALKGIEEIEGQRHKDNFYHTLEVVDNICAHTENLWLRWAALLHDIGKAPCKKYVPSLGWTFHNHEFVGAKMVYKIFQTTQDALERKDEIRTKARADEFPTHYHCGRTCDRCRRAPIDF